jgi:hypothetical protein
MDWDLSLASLASRHSLSGDNRLKGRDTEKRRIIKYVVIAAALICANQVTLGPSRARGGVVLSTTYSCNGRCLNSISFPVFGNDKDPGGVNTSNLQTLFDSLPATGGTIFLHADLNGGKRYAVSRPLALKSRTTLICDKGVTFVATSTFNHKLGAGGAVLVNRNFNANAITDHDITVAACGADESAFHGTPATITGAKRDSSSVLALTVRELPAGMAIALAAHYQVNASIVGVTGDSTMNGVFRVLAASGYTIKVVSAGPYPSAVAPINATVAMDNAYGGALANFRMVRHIRIYNPICNDIGDCTKFQATDDTVVRDGYATNIKNACWDHFEGATNLHVSGGYCQSLWYGVLATGTDVTAKLSKYSRNGDVTGGSYVMTGGGGGAGVEFNGGGPRYASATCTISGIILTCQMPIGTIVPNATVAPFLDLLPETIILPYGTNNTTGTGGAGTYTLNHSQRVSKKQIMVFNGSGASSMYVKSIKVSFTTQLASQLCWRVMGNSAHDSIVSSSCLGGVSRWGGEDGGFPSHGNEFGNHYSDPFSVPIKIGRGPSYLSFVGNTLTIGHGFVKAFISDYGYGDTFCGNAFPAIAPDFDGQNSSRVVDVQQLNNSVRNSACEENSNLSSTTRKGPEQR